jgi:transposase
MNKHPLYVGVDMSKQYFDAAICPEREPIALGKYPNNQAGWTQFVKEATATAKKHGYQSVHLVVEPTGGYQLPLVSFVFDHGWQVSMPNPKRVRDWGKGMGTRAKHDPLDSRLLVQFGVACQPEPENQLPEEIASLDSLLRRQEDLQKMLRGEKNRAEALDYKTSASPAVKESIERSIAWLEKELTEVDGAIKELLNKHPNLKKEARLLETVAGVGDKTVLPLLVFLYRWQARTAGQGTAKGLVAFAGLDPQENSSGSSVWRPPTISKMGCTFTRHKLYMAAQGGVRARSGPLRHFYDRLRGRGKAYRLAIIAAARKILVWAFAVFSRKIAFDPSLPVYNSP